jgi:hypothetical protein
MADLAMTAPEVKGNVKANAMAKTAAGQCDFVIRMGMEAPRDKHTGVTARRAQTHAKAYWRQTLAPLPFGRCTGTPGRKIRGTKHWLDAFNRDRISSGGIS